MARATRIGLIVDGADYFMRLREALMAARHQVLLIGWDFDFEIDMLPGESDADGRAPDGLPNALGDFLETVADRTPDLKMYLLKWNGALLIAPGRLVPSLAMHVWSNPNIHFALDGHHPFGACHHQKIVVVDDRFAFCGGIDVTEDRWDTSEHAPDDPRRKRPDGTPSQPWHDATTALEGPVATTLGELARTRWKRATGEELEPPPEGKSPSAWPDALPEAMRDVEVAIARTEPPYDEEPFVDEIEHLFLDGIRAARRWLYIESQYFASRSVCDAIEARLRERNGPEIVVVNPETAQNTVEDRAMNVTRGRAIKRLRAADRENRFRLLHPVNAAEEPIYVHAKVMIVDDRLLKIGSSNLNDRSMGFDTECDVAIEENDEATRSAILAFRHRLIGEHLGRPPEEVAAATRGAGSMTAAIDRLNAPRGRGLRAIEPMPETALGDWLADTRFLDPRFRSGEASHSGRGLRPRHLAIAGLAAAGVALLVWALRRER
jgi:phosphatidylserine/phosphatidylglycerophosphate/cardiolipin synthase-like enzyme